MNNFRIMNHEEPKSTRDKLNTRRLSKGEKRLLSTSLMKKSIGTRSQENLHKIIVQNIETPFTKNLDNDEPH